MKSKLYNWLSKFGSLQCSKIDRGTEYPIKGIAKCWNLFTFLKLDIFHEIPILRGQVHLLKCKKVLESLLDFLYKITLEISLVKYIFLLMLTISKQRNIYMLHHMNLTFTRNRWFSIESFSRWKMWLHCANLLWLTTPFQYSDDSVKRSVL